MKNRRARCAELYLQLSGILLAFAVIVSGALGAKYAQSPLSAGRPPLAPVRAVTDEYFGAKVLDPYRYMEKLEDPEVAQWFSQQDAYTRSVLAQIPGRAALLERIKQFDQTGPARILELQRFGNSRIYYEKRLPDEDVAKLYVRTGLDGSERLLVDPNQYAAKPGSILPWTSTHPPTTGAMSRMECHPQARRMRSFTSWTPQQATKRAKPSTAAGMEGFRGFPTGCLSFMFASRS